MVLIEMLLLAITVAAISDAIRRYRKGETWTWRNIDVPWPIVGTVAATLLFVFTVVFVGAII